MTTYFDSLVEQIQRERRQAGAGPGRGYGSFGFGVSRPPSALLEKLTEEMGYTPPEAGRFALLLDLEVRRVGDSFESGRAARERDAAALKGFRAVEERLEAEFRSLTPYGVNPEKAVARAAETMTRLSAVRHLVSFIPSCGEDPGITDKTEAQNAARERMVGRLRAWRDRLRVERSRLHDEINALPAEEARALLDSPGFMPSPPLRRDLEAVIDALEAAGDNLSGHR